MHEIHHSVRVDPDQCHPLQAGDGIHPYIRCARKEWIPQTKRFSDESAAPSLRTVWK